MERFPIIITLGAGLLGWVAGEMLVSDSFVSGWIETNAAYFHYLVPALGVILVIFVGRWLASRHPTPSAV
jgi:predicted tellurium resistance membrane protein TerC